jgi:ribosome-associated protein
VNKTNAKKIPATEKPQKIRKSLKPIKSKILTSKDIAHVIAQAAYDTKAVDLKTLDLRKLAAFTDYFIIASGTSDRHVQAIADTIQSKLKEKKMTLLGVEGYQKGHWILIDCGSVLAHIFYQEAREFYGLEKLWSDASTVRFKFK